MRRGAPWAPAVAARGSAVAVAVVVVRVAAPWGPARGPARLIIILVNLLQISKKVLESHFLIWQIEIHSSILYITST